MNCLLSLHHIHSFVLLAQDEVQFVEWSWPASITEAVVLFTIIGMLIFWTLEWYRRDSRELSRAWRIVLPLLRLTAIVGLLIVFLNPRTRTQTWADRPSRVAVVVDISSSMRNPASDPENNENSNSTVSQSRYEQIVELLKTSSWLQELRQQHEVTVYTFDSTLSERLATLASLTESQDPDLLTPSETSTESALVDWEELLLPAGNETRLGEVTSQLMREINGQTLAGIILISDGAGNAGVDVQSANDLARQLRVRLFALGTGGLKPPVNLEVAKVVAPTDVQLGDPFDIESYIRGEGLAGQAIKVDLLAREPGADADAELYPVDQQEISLLEDYTPVQVRFPIQPKLEGEWEYQVRASPVNSLNEVKTTDNERAVIVNAYQRPVKVLILAGGPSWDYRFLCGILNRHPGFEVDAFLQSGAVGISQDVGNLLYSFPEQKAELFEYDSIICFDPDWGSISEQSRNLFEDWIGSEGGGAIFIAGDINTPFLAGAREEFGPILDLHPVFLDTVLPGIDFISASTQIRPIRLTTEGLSTPILQLSEEVDTKNFWEQFPGFYRFYPTAGVKSGASVYAKAGGAGEITETEPPVVLASQFYGQGRTYFLGSPEFYRLRAEDPAYFERFWTRITRDSAQNRLRRSNPRGTLLLDQQTVMIGDLVKLRARVLDADFEPYQADTMEVEFERPDGTLVSPLPQLRPEPGQPGIFVGELRTVQAGRHQIRLRVPGTDSLIRESLIAEFPDLENRDLVQDVRQLRLLTADTGGGYYPLREASQIVALLPDSSEQFLLGEQIMTLWDRSWLMGLIVGLLSLEWLSRKLLKLA